MLFCDVLTSGIKRKFMLVAIVAMFHGGPMSDLFLIHSILEIGLLFDLLHNVIQSPLFEWFK